MGQDNSLPKFISTHWILIAFQTQWNEIECRNSGISHQGEEFVRTQSCLKVTSIFPIYSYFKLPYAAICREKYHNTSIRQFDKEINLLEQLQTSALDGVRFLQQFHHAEVKEVEEIIKNDNKRTLRFFISFIFTGKFINIVNIN